MERFWRDMDTAPKNATEILLLRKRADDQCDFVRAHWACGGGDDQPPFGPAWFENVIDKHTGRSMYCREIEGPFVGWQPLPGIFESEIA